MELVLQFIYVLGFFQGIIISLILFFKNDGLAFKLLGCLTFLLSLGCLLDGNFPNITDPILLLSWNANQFLYGPLLFLFVKYSVTEQNEFRRPDLLHFLPFIAFKALVILEYTTGIISSIDIPLHSTFVLVTYSLGYTIHALNVSIRRTYQKQLRHFLIKISTACLILWIFSLISNHNNAQSGYLNFYSLVYIGAVICIYFISVKLFSEPEFFKSTSKIDSRSWTRGVLNIRNNRQVHLLDFDDIYWIEAQDNYVRIHSAHSNILHRSTMNSIEKKLHPGKFKRIHRSHIVNISQIVKIDYTPGKSNSVTLKNGKKLNIGKKYVDTMTMLLNDWSENVG